MRREASEWNNCSQETNARLFHAWNKTIKYPRRTKEQEQQFRELAALCGLRIDKVGKRQRRGYRIRRHALSNNDVIHPVIH